MDSLQGLEKFTIYELYMKSLLVIHRVERNFCQLSHSQDEAQNRNGNKEEHPLS